MRFPLSGVSARQLAAVITVCLLQAQAALSTPALTHNARFRTLERSIEFLESGHRRLLDVAGAPSPGAAAAVDREKSVAVAEAGAEEDLNPSGINGFSLNEDGSTASAEQVDGTKVDVEVCSS